MNLEFTITLGDLLTISAFVLTGIGVYLRLVERLIRIETKLDPLWEDWIAHKDG